MANKKNTSSTGKLGKATFAAPGKAPAAAAPSRVPSTAPVSSTPVRNTPIPKVVAIPAPAPTKKEITHEMIARRAFEISLSGSGSQDEHWLRAEGELRAA